MMSQLRYDTNTIRKSRKMGVGFFLVRSVLLRENTLINSNGKKGTRHSVNGQFGREFPANCNHCGVMTA